MAVALSGLRAVTKVVQGWCFAKFLVGSTVVS
jgi:hypothetical protein